VSEKKDFDFKTKVWEHLTAHEGVYVGDGPAGNHLSLHEAVALPVSFQSTSQPSRKCSPPSCEFSGSDPNASAASHLVSENANSTAVLHQESQQPAVRQVQYQPRIDVSQNLKWRSITGHSVDFEKVSEPEWQCLLAIARARGNGIAQPDLITATGLGKITLGRRASALVEKNYIEKRQILTKNKKTNVFKLKEAASTSSGTDCEANPIPVPKAPRPPTRASTRPQKAHTPLPASESTSKLGKIHTKPGNSKGVAFMSYDEYQRNDGVPGVYFDLVELEGKRVGSKGRPKKCMIALFKSEKLKDFLWMHDELGASRKASTPAKIVRAGSAILSTAGIVFERKREAEFGTSTEEPIPRKFLADSARSLGVTSRSSYRSPYAQMPSTASDSVSPCEITASTILLGSRNFMSNSPPSKMQYRSPYPPSVSLQTKSNYISPYASNRKLTVEDTPVLPSLSFPISKTPEVHANSAEIELERAIEEAQSISIPNATCRLAVSYGGETGNLCLFSDRKTLEFMPSKRQLDTAAFGIQISEIVEPPQTSDKGSKPTEFRICLSKENADKVVHIFRFLSTDEEFQQANTMRAKIVTIMTLLELNSDSSSSEADDIPRREVPKPYQCDKCGGTWKNDIGLLYHQTRSQTTCNPDYDPAAPTKTRGRARKRKTLPDEDDEDAGILSDGGSGKATKRALGDMPFTESVEGDAVISPSKRYTQDDTNASNYLKLSIQLGKDIILALLDSNGQVFPGDKGLWFGFTTMWAQKYPDTQHPAQRVCNGALTLLIDSGHVQKIQFSFKDPQGKMRIGTLVTRKNADPRSLEFVETKERIKAAFPECYVPLEFAPSDVVRRMLLDQEAEHDRQTTLNSLGVSHGVSSGGKDSGVLDAELYSTMSGRVTRRVQKTHLNLQMSDSESEFEARPERTVVAHNRNDGKFTRGTLRKSRRKPGDSRHTRKIGKLDAAEPESQNTNVLLHSQVPESEAEQDTESEPPELASPSYSLASPPSQKPMTWAPATTYLQNPNTTAWNVSPIRHRAKIQRKFRLPEPITFMQTLNNPAWNFRPFGHGVRPIFTRPSRRTAGNPLGELYQERIHNGFRPVIMPNSRNRMEGPAVPSKHLLAQLSLQLGEETPKRAITKRTKRVSTPIGDPPEILHMPKRRPGRPKKDNAMPSDLNPLLGTKLLGEPSNILYTMAPPQGSGSNPRSGIGVSLHKPFKNPGLDSLPISERRASCTQEGRSAHSALRFLDPNTCLEDSTTTGLAVAPPTSSESLSQFELEQKQMSFSNVGSGGPHTISWVEPKILKAQDRMWMKMCDYEFEEESFTMQGWFPSIVDTLKQLIPRDLEDFLTLRQGRRATAAGNYATRQWVTFIEGVESVAQWEQGKGRDIVTMGTIVPEHRFINHTIDTLQRPPNQEPAKYQWLSQNQFDLQTLPYYELETDEDEGISTNTGPIRKRQRKLQEDGDHANRRKTNVIQNTLTTRRLVALPADVEGVLDEITKHQEFAVEIAFDHHQNQPRKRTRDGKMSEQAENRLIVAVIIIRTLTGGLNKVIDWVLVSKLFPEFTLHFIRKRWLGLLVKHKESIDRIGADFQHTFIGAYESGEVQPLDYNNLLSYDWNRLVDWAIEHIGTDTTATEAPELPQSRADLDHYFKVKENHVTKAWRDDYFSTLAPVHRRMDNAASEPYTVPASADRRGGGNFDILTIAKSWVRASVLTPEEDYDAQSAAQKMSALGNNIIKIAIDSLLESKVLSRRNRGRPAPGRGFDMTDTANISLRKNLGEKQFSSAIKYKAFLDAKFCAGETVVMDWAANDGETLAITNLQAHGRILTVGKGIPNNKFGLNDGGYQTKQMDKRRLLFQIEIVPTATYIYDSALGIAETLSATENLPPKSEALPIWYGISGKLIPTYWRKVVTGVLGTMALRPAIRISELGRMFAPGLTEWEIRMLVEWLVKVGALEVLMEGEEGWNVREWWWIIAGNV
jgi:B-block binding subunit of TFIIIC